LKLVLEARGDRIRVTEEREDGHQAWFPTDHESAAGLVKRLLARPLDNSQELA